MIESVFAHLGDRNRVWGLGSGRASNAECLSPLLRLLRRSETRDEERGDSHIGATENESLCAAGNDVDGATVLRVRIFENSLEYHSESDSSESDSSERSIIGSVAGR